MKRIFTNLVIVLVLLAIIGVVAAGSQDSGNSTLINDTATGNSTNETNVTIPTDDTASNGTNGTNGTNVTNATDPLTDSNSIYISALDVGSSGKIPNQEYVKITNTGASAVNMKSWAIKDAGAEHTYLFPSYTLNAKSTVTLRSGTGTNTANTLYWNKWSFIWNNNGDTAYLYNSQGNLVSSRGTNGTNATVPSASTIPVTVPPKPIPGKIIPAPSNIKNDVDKVTALHPINSGEVTYANINNEGVKITALHPLSDGVEYVSITNFNDFTAHLEGYKIHEIKCNNTITFQNIRIQPGHTLKVYTGSHPNGPDIVGTHQLHHIYNKNDTVELICACNNVISTFER